MFASIFRAVFPTMHASTPQRASDVEAQVSTDIFTPFNVAEAAPAPPPAAFTVERSRSIAHIRTTSEPTQNAVDLFFGVSSASTTSSRGTVESCHDLRPVASNSSSKDQPPAYVYPIAANINEFGVEELPTYAQTFGIDLSRRADADDEKEPASLAMYLFKFGFLCPILWFLSVFIFVSPLVAPVDWEESKTPAQREMLLARMRASELRWAKRSVFAAFVFCVVVAVIVSLVVVTHH